MERNNSLRNQSRPKDIPLANDNSSNDSLGSRPSPSSSSSYSDPSTFDIVRCSRCQRSLSLDPSSTPSKGVVRFGMNSYYCSRCATMVGFIR